MFGSLRLLSMVLLVLVVAGLPGARAGNNQSVGEAIEQFISSGQATLGSQDDDQHLFQIFVFYADRNFKPIWTRDTGAKTKAKVLLEALRTAGAHGLDPSDYGIADIEERIGSINPEVLAELDLIMSSTFAQFARDLGQGRVEPARINRDLNIRPHGPGPLYLIDGAEAADNLGPYLETIKPQTARYDRLKNKLAVYRQIARQGGWPTVPAGPTLNPGDRDRRVPVLQRMLVIMGDLNPGDARGGELYDSATVEAVRRFQWRHGRNPDGVIGPSTLAAMNVPVQKRILQMVLNLERRRWMSDDLGEFYVFVNQADQFLKVVKNGKTIHEARLVVGKPYHRTPVFTGQMSYMVFNPFWNVPSSITNSEILPILKRNPGYLQSQRFDVLKGDQVIDASGINWNAYTKLPYRLRQRSGPGNALGRVKFMFPNRHNVYIHDTPSKHLFAKEQRYFSHGCMRVQNPEQLAEVLLSGQGWSGQAVKNQMDSGQRRIVNLKRKIPVHVTYLTAWVNKDGSVHFRPDGYNRDEILAAALLGG